MLEANKQNSNRLIHNWCFKHLCCFSITDYNAHSFQHHKKKQEKVVKHLMSHCVHLPVFTLQLVHRFFLFMSVYHADKVSVLKHP